VVAALAPCAEDVFIEYASSAKASGPEVCVALAELAALSGGFRPPCGWQRFWRLRCPSRGVLWDRAARIWQAPVLPAAARAMVTCGCTHDSRIGDSSPRRSGEVSDHIFRRLPAVVFARIVLCCDIASLLRCSVALPLLGRLCLVGANCVGQRSPAGSEEHSASRPIDDDFDACSELAVVMPQPHCHGGRPSEGSHQPVPRGEILGHRPSAARQATSWLSFARASLRWAELWSTIGEAMRVSAPRRDSSAPGAVADGTRQHPRRSPLSSSSGPIPLKTFAGAVAVDAQGSRLLATGHDQAIRLWQLPELKRLGLLRIRGCASCLDLGFGGRLLCACIVAPHNGDRLPQDGGGVDGDGGDDGGHGDNYVAGRAADPGQEPQGVITVWDLEVADSSWKPLWQIVLSGIIGLAFCGVCPTQEGVLAVVLSRGVLLLDSATGSQLSLVQLPGQQPVACCCRLASAPSQKIADGIVVGGANQGIFAFWPDLNGREQGAHRIEALDGGEVLGRVTAVSASSTEVVGAGINGRVLVWQQRQEFTADALAGDMPPAEGRAVSLARPSPFFVQVATMEAFTREVAESLAWASTDASFETLAGRLHITRLLAVDELVLCVVGLRSAPLSSIRGCGILAWHAPTGSRIPHPWHSAGPLGGFFGNDASDADPLVTSRSIHCLASEPGLEWSIVGCAGDGASAGFTSVVARSCQKLRPLRHPGRLS